MPTMLAFGYFDRDSPRHRSVCDTYKREGWTIEECRTDAKGFFAKYRDLARQYKNLRSSADAVFVAFPGHFLMPLAWKLTRRPSKKLFFDAFISLYDTEVLDRKRWSKWHPRAWVLWMIDRLSVTLADEVIVDTQAHRNYFVRTFGLDPKRVRVVYLEALKDIFTPGNGKPRNEKPEIVFYGTLIPLHGIEIIGSAIRELVDQGCAANFIFAGPEKLGRVVRSWNLPSVKFRGFLTLPEIAEMLRNADLALGIFGTSGKASRVIPHKVVDAVACGTPVITADTPAIRERFADHPLVRFIPAGNSQALARAIRASLPAHAVSAI